MKKYLIIGGVAGGASTAARLRRMDETAEIILFERGPYISYANCGLPYYIGNVIKEREKLFVQTPESFGTRFNIDVRVNSNVEKIDPANKSVTIRRVQSGEVYNETYDKLVLSPGAEPVRPPLPGIDTEGIFTLRNVADTDRIKKHVTEKKIRKAVVVGAGFIGLEMAENLVHLGIETTVVEMLNQVMPPVDFEIASFVHAHFKDKEVGLLLNEAVAGFSKKENRIEVSLRSGGSLEADVVILSIGVRPDTTLAREAGLQIGETGGIYVNEYLQTSDENIYAVGDAIEFVSPISGKPSLSFLAAPANKQGRICADNMVYGNRIRYKGTINTAIAKVFDLTVATAGLSSKMLDRLGIDHQTAIVHSGSHAGYYPGAIPMTIKINFSPVDGRLLGAQAVGYKGVDKRVDIMAEVIRHKGTIYDLTEVEHAYAPPFSSAKDPVNMVGFVAENILLGRMNPIQWNQINEIKENVTLLDIRTKHEFGMGSITGAVNIPVDQLRDELHRIPKDKPVVLFCAVGLRGHVGSRILMQLGYNDVKNLIGGYKTYQAATAMQSNPLSPTIKQLVKEKTTFSMEKLKIDACGLQCPGPVLKLKTGIDKLQVGEMMTITATDSGFARDVESWARVTGNKVISLENKHGVITAVIEKGEEKCSISHSHGAEGKTIIVFSDDLDKALASFVIANGAAAMGRKVTMFFTFWGLSVIKNPKAKGVEKDLIGKMFGMMLPKSSKALALSKMNMGGLGPRMMRWVMKRNRIDSLETLIKEARKADIEMIACQMSMDVMGVKKEELYDFVTIGGVAAYLEKAEEASVNLFI